MARKPKTDPFLEDAQAQSIIRYGPELSALKSLLTAAETSYTDRVRQARSSREFSVGAVDRALPQVQQAYQGAQQAVAPQFAQAGGVEAQALAARMAEAQALAQSQLYQRRVSAVEGEGALRSQAQRELSQDRQKIGDRGTDLAREIGAFVTQTAGSSRAAATAAQAEVERFNAQLVQDERNSIRSSGTDPDTGLPTQDAQTVIDNANRTPSKKWASQEQHASASDEIANLQTFAAKLRSEKVSRKDAVSVLLNGAEADEVPIYEKYKDADGKVKTRKKLIRDDQGNIVEATRKRAAVPKASSQVLLKAALDMAYDGHLSRATQKLLHDRNLQIGQLGDLVTFGEWLKTPEGQEWDRRRRGGTPGNKNASAAIPGIGSIT